jgi:DnaJ-class molecular chaperone
MADPYELLGVSRSAGAEDIKQAYRKLAKQLHPDLNPGDATIERRFKDISAAYDLLSDPKKRARYDRGEIDANGTERPASRFYRGFSDRAGSRAGAGAGAGFANFDTDDIFEMFTQQARGGRGAGAGKRRGVDVSYSLSVDFTAAALGTRRRLTLPDQRTLDVQIPPGTAEGSVLRLKGQGQTGMGGGPAGDAFVEIQVEPHAHFQRKEFDIHLDVPVTLQEAALGSTITVPTIDGKVVVKIPRGSNSGTTLRLKARGVPRGKGGERGDQYVKLTVVLPEKIDTELAQFLERWGPTHPYNVRGKLGLED